ncbi:iron/zinc purple acid phosphatase-like protein [Alligator mississippiensis]|uniref:Purple acid phosphatase n=2 Tax=Alligator mississippiensis TaxID=8496 RepID=A0A151MLZ8_ALLMI|nr:iron/zinc purple acid phosphatase-like protein [Alligator mississippiensis]
MTVTWATLAPAGSVVRFGQAPGPELPWQATGSTQRFVDGGFLRRVLYMHRVTLRGLVPGQRYVYRCGSQEGWSRRFQFRALRNGTAWSPRVAVYGDMGLENPRALPRLQREARAGLYDAVLHVGDFAYDMDWNDARVGDAFMRRVEPLAATVPYMTCPGNHEQK